MKSYKFGILLKEFNPMSKVWILSDNLDDIQEKFHTIHLRRNGYLKLYQGSFVQKSDSSVSYKDLNLIDEMRF